MTNKIKLIFINTVNLEENGISSFILNNSYILTNWNVEVTIIAPNKVNSDLKSALRKNNINLIELPMRNKKPYVYFVKLLSIFKKKKCDVVHVNGNSTTMSVELLAAYLAGIKVRIAHSHNTTTDHKRINKLLRPIFDVVANGRIACNTAAGKWLFKNKSFLIIRNGINLSNFKFDATMRKKYRDKLGLNENDILLGHVGRFTQQKNHDFLIDIFNEIHERNQNTKLLLIGTGIKEKDIKEKVKNLNLQDSVIFEGFKNNVNEYMFAMDIFLFPSKFEGLGLVLIEAQATGLPCYTSKDVVPNEAKVSNLLEYISLKNSAKEWSQYIINNRNKRLNEYKKIKNGGYDIEDTAKLLQCFYLESGEINDRK